MPPTDPNIIEKLKKLINHQISAQEIGSIKEAEAFAEKIQQLLSQHKLSMSDCEAKVEEEAGVGQSAVPLAGKKGEKNALLDKPGVIQWLWTLANNIAQCNDCSALCVPSYKNVEWPDAQKRLKKLKHDLVKMKELVGRLGFGNHAITELESEIKLLERGKECTGVNTYLFVGVDADRLAVVELYKYFSALCWEMACKEGEKHRDTFKSLIQMDGEGNLSKKTHEFRHSYCQGFADTIAKRLQEQRAAMLASQNSCNALVLVDRRALMVNDWMGKHAKGDKLTQGYKAGEANAMAYVLGQKMGQQVNLSGKEIGQ